MDPMWILHTIDRVVGIEICTCIPSERNTWMGRNEGLIVLCSSHLWTLLIFHHSDRLKFSEKNTEGWNYFCLILFTSSFNSFCLPRRIIEHWQNTDRAGQIMYGTIHKVCTRWGGGGCQRSDHFLRTIVLIGCVKSVREGGGGPKSRTFCVRSPWMLP